MSGVVKSVGKVFRKVAKPVAKLAPAALAIGALVFTAGAALGALPTWGAAMTQMSSSLGLSSTLTNVLGGALTQAGYGAALGAAGSLLTGGDPMKGAQAGALAGAVTGGATGAMGWNTDPLSGLNSDVPGDTSILKGGPLGDALASPEAQRGYDFGGMTGAGPAAGPPSMAPAAGPQQPAARGLFSQGGWLERNQELVGGVVKGAGEGVVRGLVAQSEGRDQADLLRTRHELIAGNYRGSGRGLLTPADMAYASQQPARPTPADRFDPATYAGNWIYDAALGRLVFVPNQAQA